MRYYAVKYRDSYGMNGLFLFMYPGDAYEMYRALECTDGDFYSYSVQESLERAVSPDDVGIGTIDFSKARECVEEFRGVSLSSMIELDGGETIIKIFDDGGKPWLIRR